MDSVPVQRALKFSANHKRIQKREKRKKTEKKKKKEAQVSFDSTKPESTKCR